MPFDAGSITSNMTIDVSPFRQGMLQAQGIASTFGQTITNFVASPLLGIVGVAKQAGEAIAGALSSGIGTGLKLAGEAESVRIAFEVLLGSAAAAKKMLADLQKFAADTPFELPEVVQTAKQFTAFGMAADRILPNLKAIGDVASLVDQRMGDLGLVFAQVMAKGKLQGEELLQFAEKGVPLRRQLEQMLGVSGGAFDKLVESGKVTFAQVEEAFGRLTGKGGQFADGMKKASEGIKGLLSNLEDTKGALLRGLGEGFAEGLGFKELIGDAVTTLAGFQTMANEFGRELGSALRPIVSEVMGWVKNHPDEAKEKVRDAARTIVSAVRSVGDAARALLPIAGFVADHLKEIAYGAAGLGAVKVLTSLAEAYKAVAVAAAAAKVAQAGGPAAAGGGGLAAATGQAGVAGLAGAGVVAANGGGTNATIGGGIGTGAGWLIGSKLGGYFGPVGSIGVGLLFAAGGMKIGEASGAQLDMREYAGRHGGKFEIVVQPGEDPKVVAEHVGRMTAAELAKFFREREAVEASRRAVQAGL